MIIASSRGDVPVTTARDATLGALIRATGGSLRSDTITGITASKTDIAGLPAVQQAIRIAAWSMAKHSLGVFRGPDESRVRVSATWQARFFANPPNERDSWFYTWECTEASLTARNNAFWHRVFSGGQVARVQVLHPDCVDCRWNRQDRRVEYRYLDEGGGWSPWLYKGEIMHFRVGAPDPGAIIAPSPIELHRRVWAAAVAKTRAEGDFYGKGMQKTTAVVFPGEVTEEQALNWKDVYLGPGGIDRGSEIKVFGGGPTLETIGISLQDAQYIESQTFSIFDVGRMLGVLPSLLWAAEAKGGDKPITPEHEEDRWFRYGMEPRRLRIEETIKADPGFFGSGARDYPLFIASRPRSDAVTESTMLVREVQAGIRTPNEARAPLGLSPVADGDVLQITPVGGAENPNLSDQLGGQQQ